MAFSPGCLKQITSISLTFAPLSESIASKSMRLLLANIPAKPISPGVEPPQITTATVSRDELQAIEVTYKNKQSLKFDFRAVSMPLPDLIRKLEQPAKALRMKEEGV